MPTPETSAARHRILENLGLLDAAIDPPLDRLAHIAARATASPIAWVTFIGRDRQWNRARFGAADAVTPLADSFCICAVDTPVLLEVPDARKDQRFAEYEPVRGPLGVRFYAGQPILFDGIGLGTVCVLDVVPRALTAADREVLADLSAVVSDLLRTRDEHRLRLRDARRALDCAGSAGDWLWETDDSRQIVWLSGRHEGTAARAAGDAIYTQLADGAVFNWLGRPRVPPVTLHQLLDARLPFESAVMAVEAPSGTAPSTIRLVSRSGTPFDDDHGRPAGFRGICRDVTARVQAEVRALDADIAMRANRTKSEFLSRVSHELRTPLNAILGFGQLLLIEDDDYRRLSAAQLSRLDAIRLAGHRLLALIDDMLDLTRIEQGKTDIVLRALDLQALMRSTELLLRPAALLQGVAVRNLGVAGISVIGDERALGQVLLNLISNAIKFSPPGGLVSVHAEDDGDTSYVLIVVEDNGVGMSAQQLAGLFQPFNRLGAESGPVAGTGLGLVISKSLVELMGGSLTLRSVRGSGTSAVVRLPKQLAKALAAPAAAVESDAPSADIDRRRLLYVERNATDAALMAELIATEPSWSLEMAQSGARGIECSRAGPYDLVIIDMQLPDMGGLELLDQLRSLQQLPRYGCVALWADALPDQIGTALAAGFVQCWTKPLDLRATLARLSALMHAD